MPLANPKADVVGVGLNALDTIICVPRLPGLDSKMELLAAHILPGGQVASAMVACRTWGLLARYIGAVGDDHAASLHRAEFDRHGVEAHLFAVQGCQSQFAYILVDQTSGERSILWKRDARLAIKPESLRREWITDARALLVDGHDAPAAATAARWAREAGIPVVADLDNLYTGAESLLEHVDYLFASRDFPERLTRTADLLDSLPQIATRFGCRVSAATLGRHGVLAYSEGRFFYCPGFRVATVDTTGAGDIFHAGIVYSVLQGWPLSRILEFSCAAAALNCTAIGARGGIRLVAEIESLMAKAERHAAPENLSSLTKFRIKSQGILE